MTQKRITNTQLAELILTELHDLAESSGYDSFWNIRAIVRKFGESDYQKVFNIVKVLEQKGLVMPIYAFGGVLEAKITGAGSLFVENGGETGIIKEYHREPSQFILNIENVTNSSIAVLSDEVNQTLDFKIEDSFSVSLIEMKNTVANDQNITREQKIDLIADIDTLKIQISKKNRNEYFINAILKSLEEIPSLKSYSEQLKKSL